MIVYISIGNSDDKLSQKQWSDLYYNVAILLRGISSQVHGEWVSEPTSPWQNACWCIEFHPDELLVTLQGHYAKRIDFIQEKLKELAHGYGQESIAWAEAPETKFLGPEREYDGDSTL